MHPDSYVSKVRLRNYRCVTDATLALTPLHALVGPNDSGKSTLLRALHGCVSAGLGSMGPAEDLTTVATLWIGNPVYQEINFRPVGPPVDWVTDQKLPAWRSTFVRFKADMLAQGGPLITDVGEPKFTNDQGAGLGSVLDYLINRDLDWYLELRAQIRELFPTVSQIGLRNPTSSEKQVFATLTDGREVSAREMSEGMLFYLGFAVLGKLSRSTIFLVEEPENGLHPTRIAEVMAMLRKISERSQVIVTTHSPLVVNELDSREVTIVSRTREEGTKCTRLSDTPNYADRSRVYSNGELWLTYADGQTDSLDDEDTDQ